MHELLGDFMPAREVVPWMMIVAALGIGVFYLIDRIEPPGAQSPWRWGDEPRRPRQPDGLAGHLIGVLSFLVVFFLVLRWGAR